MTSNNGRHIWWAFPRHYAPQAALNAYMAWFQTIQGQLVTATQDATFITGFHVDQLALPPNATLNWTLTAMFWKIDPRHALVDGVVVPPPFFNSAQPVSLVQSEQQVQLSPAMLDSKEWLSMLDHMSTNKNSLFDHRLGLLQAAISDGSWLPQTELQTIASAHQNPKTTKTKTWHEFQATSNLLSYVLCQRVMEIVGNYVVCHLTSLISFCRANVIQQQRRDPTTRQGVFIVALRKPVDNKQNNESKFDFFSAYQLQDGKTLINVRFLKSADWTSTWLPINHLLIYNLLFHNKIINSFDGFQQNTDQSWVPVLSCTDPPVVDAKSQLVLLLRTNNNLPSSQDTNFWSNMTWARVQKSVLQLKRRKKPIEEKVLSAGSELMKQSAKELCACPPCRHEDTSFKWFPGHEYHKEIKINEQPLEEIVTTSVFQDFSHTISDDLQNRAMCGPTDRKTCAALVLVPSWKQQSSSSRRVNEFLPKSFSSRLAEIFYMSIACRQGPAEGNPRQQVLVGQSGHAEELLIQNLFKMTVEETQKKEEKCKHTVAEHLQVQSKDIDISYVFVFTTAPDEWGASRIVDFLRSKKDAKERSKFKGFWYGFLPLGWSCGGLETLAKWQTKQPQQLRMPLYHSPKFATGLAESTVLDDRFKTKLTGVYPQPENKKPSCDQIKIVDLIQHLIADPTKFSMTMKSGKF